MAADGGDLYEFLIIGGTFVGGFVCLCIVGFFIYYFFVRQYVDKYGRNSRQPSRMGTLQRGYPPPPMRQQQYQMQPIQTVTGQDMYKPPIQDMHQQQQQQPVTQPIPQPHYTPIGSATPVGDYSADANRNSWQYQQAVQPDSSHMVSSLPNYGGGSSGVPPPNYTAPSYTPAYQLSSSYVSPVTTVATAYTPSFSYSGTTPSGAGGGNGGGVTTTYRTTTTTTRQAMAASYMAGSSV